MKFSTGLIRFLTLAAVNIILQKLYGIGYIGPALVGLTATVWDVCAHIENWKEA